MYKLPLLIALCSCLRRDNKAEVYAHALNPADNITCRELRMESDFDAVTCTIGLPVNDFWYCRSDPNECHKIGPKLRVITSDQPAPAEKP